jgi:hypothetical protein
VGRPSNAERIRGLCEVFEIPLDLPGLASLRPLMPDDEIAESALLQYLRGIGSAADYMILDSNDPATLKRDLDWFRDRHGLG